MPARPPLDSAALGAGLIAPGSFVTALDVADELDSTNSALLAAPDAAEGTVLVAEFQTAGRGRLDRSWASPPRAGLTFSLLLRPAMPVHAWGWLPLLAGLGTRAAVRTLAPDLDVALKWPNDVLLGTGQRKGAGILAQAGGGAVVIGIGLNVSQTADELPTAEATSLLLEGSPLDRGELLVAVLGEISDRYLRLVALGGDARASGLHGEYVGACATLGREVSLTHAGLPVRGTATGIDTTGALELATGSGALTVSAGDVSHVRPVNL